MKILDFMYTDKGKITASVLLAVIISTVILVPSSIFIDRGIREEEDINIKTFGFDDNVTSTGARQDEWMNITSSEMVDASGQEILSREATLLKNPSYTGVTIDEDLMNGVASTNGLGYLSNSHVSNDSRLKPLNISNDNGETWITPTNSDYISAPLNMTMKVPEGVATIIKQKLIKEPTELKVADLNGLFNDVEVNLDSAIVDEVDETTDVSKSYNYGDWLVEQELTSDFALSILMFSWIGQTLMAQEALNVKYSTTNEPLFLTKEEFFDWANVVFGGEDREKWGIISEDHTKWAFNNEELLIDGTGTNQDAVDIACESFGTIYNSTSYANGNINIQQNLANGSSNLAWETAENDDIPPGVVFNKDEYDGSNDGSKKSFIGTQSRGIETASMKTSATELDEIDGEISYWGYNETIYDSTFDDDESSLFSSNNVTADDVGNMFYDFDALLNTDGTPLAFTIAGDSVVFFTNNDTVFEYSGETYKPTGITPDGAKLAFQYGTTWDLLYDMGLISAEKVE